MRESITDVMVACNNCGSRTGLGFLGAGDAANAAVKREVCGNWNTRVATPPVPAGEVGELVAWLEQWLADKGDDFHPETIARLRQAAALLERYAAALEDLPERIEQEDLGGMSDWDDGYASGLRKAAEIARAALSSPCNLL
jgi:hypothetical protein